MTPFKSRALAITLALASCTAVNAEGFHAGIKFGAMDADFNGFDTAINTGFMFGYDFLKKDRLSVGVEIDITSTTSDGDVKLFGRSGSWDIDTQAIYAAVRYDFAQNFYGKAKAGILREEVNATLGHARADEDDTGASIGLGAGWRITDQIALETEYIIIEEDVDFLSIGAIFSF